MDNVVVLVANRRPSTKSARPVQKGRVNRAQLRLSLPDAITIYRRALLDACDSEDEVVDQVAITV